MKQQIRPLTISVLAVAMLLAACGTDEATTTTSGSTTSGDVTTTTLAGTPSTTLSPSTVPTRPDPVEGWGRIEVDTEVFGDIRPVAGAAANGVFVLVGCSAQDSDPFPVWRAEGGFDFERAAGPDVERPFDVRCIQEVVSTPFGWFAGGSGPLLRSVDGASWEVVDLSAILGYEASGQLGYADNLFVDPDGSRLTVLFRRAAQAESTVANFVTTTDGETWVENAHPSQALFDSSGIASIIEGGDGLVAAGASPGGEFAPTAAVFTSPDGLSWRRVTPRGDPDFEDKVIEDVMRIGDRFVAVGGDFFQTGLMTAWSSPDGIEWRRLPYPPEATDPSVAQMTAQVLTVADGSIWASGRDFDARRGEPQSLPAIWRSPDGENWERVPLDQLEINVPFEIASTPDLRIGIWPPPAAPIDEPLVLYAAD